MIGIVGGMGPSAGLDLFNRIISNTIATTDQEHPSVAMISTPGSISDRTKFLLGEVEENPAYAIAKNIKSLEQIGCNTVGIACNTAHAEKIFNIIESEVAKTCNGVKLLNLIDETIEFIIDNYPSIKNIGLLSTTGTYNNRIYIEKLKSYSFNVLRPTLEIQNEFVHNAVYNPEYGIKANSNPICQTAIDNLIYAANYLIQNGAELIILGCTEIPLALNSNTFPNITFINPTEVLARKLLKLTYPDKLKPLNQPKII